MPESSAGNEVVRIPYGSADLVFQLPAGVRLAGTSATASSRASGLLDTPAEMTEHALREPIASETLARRAQDAQRVVLIVDDLTRVTPVADMLPRIIGQLQEAGVPDSAIELLIALGTHRAMTEPEIEQRFGSDIVRRFRVTNHDAFDSDTLVDLGETVNGTPILVNRAVVEADLVVGIGSIVPHRYCGWSGGAKIVQPGVCGESTTIATHMMVNRPGVALGRTENAVRAEMELVAQSIGIDYICNAIIDPHGRCIGVVAGHIVAAHRAGVDLALKASAVTYRRRAEIVIAGSHPADINLWQAGKGLYAADVVAEDGGDVYLVSPLHEGVGEHPEYVYLLRYPMAEIERRYRDGEAKDGISVAAALAVKQLMDRARVVLVTDGLAPADEARVSMDVIATADFQSALDGSLRAAGPEARVIVLPTAPETLPMVEST
jgi:lactate racemase